MRKKSKVLKKLIEEYVDYFELNEHPIVLSSNVKNWLEEKTGFEIDVSSTFIENDLFMEVSYEEQISGEDGFVTLSVEVIGAFYQTEGPRIRKIYTLHDDLIKAVESENYEKAAKLRDKIKKLNS